MAQQFASTGLIPAIGTRWAKPSDDQLAFSAQAKMPVAGTINLTPHVKLRMVLIPPGTFTMGSETSPYKEERPLHRVHITRPFYMGIYPVRQVEWEAVMEGENPSRFREAHHPVERVTWHDAREFCRLAGRNALGTLRLPTEAEWEYACRAGATSEYYFGHTRFELASHAWYGAARIGGRTHRVGQKVPNAWGLFDMLGNVWEWCDDYYGEDYYAVSPAEDPPGPPIGRGRVTRGGAWNDEYVSCRCAYRRPFPPDKKGDDLGFRVVLVPPPETSETPPPAETGQSGALVRGAGVVGRLLSRLGVGR